ncbi:MAG TPA: formate--tetrahydrofolate ligase [Firmicutes bacterium]|nr:formate--tetrahydrofolate ligase [Bacillota bacterium]
MLSDIEIAQQARLRPIVEVAGDLGLTPEEIEPYGKYKAKVGLDVLSRLEDAPLGKLIYTTGITATPAGEGKTCTAVGLAQALGKLGKRVSVAIREPSLGPTFGVKGGAAGGGYSQVLPMEDINLHFTGDIHAVGAAHNLLAAMIDNHITHGNALGIDPLRVVWRRVIDVSDRQLRNIVVGLGGKGNGFPRETGFDITAASEVMAILCLARGMGDLKERLRRMVVAYTFDGRPVTAQDLGAVGAMAILLKDAIKPNLVQTLEGQPAFVHGGPFANIAHGNSSLVATELALRLSDYVVTEGGFASDLGAEKFFDIVLRLTSIRPAVAVVVVSVRALHHHGGVEKSRLQDKNLAALQKGYENLDKHLENLRDNFGVPCVVAINRFPHDDKEELESILAHCNELGVRAAISEVVARGGEGGIDLAREVLSAIEEGGARFRFLYDLDMSVKDKIEVLARRVYGAQGVIFTAEADRTIRTLTEQGFSTLPVCVAKTQLSLSDDPSLRGAPTGWTLTVREVRLASGAGFIVALCGPIMTMPGLPAHPAAERMDIDDNGRIAGLS